MSTKVTGYVETRAGLPLEGSEVSRGCFQPQTLGSANDKLDFSQSDFRGGYRSVETQGSRGANQHKPEGKRGKDSQHTQTRKECTELKKQHRCQ